MGYFSEYQPSEKNLIHPQTWREETENFEFKVWLWYGYCNKFVWNTQSEFIIKRVGSDLDFFYYINFF